MKAKRITQLDLLIQQPKKVFLMDSLGAFLTAFFLGVVLASLESVFGMPANVLYPLAIAALCFGVYSLGCFLFLVKRFRAYLRLIILANLLYAVVTPVLVGYFFVKLSWLGITYFVLELVVLSIVIWIELKVLSRIPSESNKP